MAKRGHIGPGIPDPDELSLIAPDSEITPEALSSWVEHGTTGRAKEERDRARRMGEQERRRRAGRGGRVPQGAARSARMGVDELVEIDDLSMLINDQGGKPYRRRGIPKLDFGVVQGGADDLETWDWHKDYYGRDDAQGAEQELVDALDAFFSEAAVPVNAAPGSMPPPSREATGHGQAGGAPPRRRAGGRRVIPTPLASDYGEDDDAGDDEPRYSSLFAMPDADDRPFSVNALGRVETRRMGTTLQRFLDGDVRLGTQMCALWRGFPSAYGIPVGRQRYSGFAARPVRDVLTGEDFGEATHMSLARVRSYDRFMRDLADGDPYAVEFLGVDRDDILYVDSSARAILESADAFLSRRCGERALEVARDLMRQIGRPADQDETYGAERRIRAIRAIDDAKEGFTEAYGRFARVYVDVQNHMGRPTVMASLDLHDMPLSEMGDFSLALSDIAEAYGLVADMRGATSLRGEALAHAMCEVVRLLQTASQLLDGEGLEVLRKRGSHVLEGIVRGRLIGPDGRPLPSYWDIVDEEQIRLEDSIDLTDLPAKADIAEVERLIAERNRNTILEDA